MDSPSPNAAGVPECSPRGDRFTISGSHIANLGIPELCGDLTGQHSKSYSKPRYTRIMR